MNGRLPRREDGMPDGRYGSTHLGIVHRMQFMMNAVANHSDEVVRSRQRAATIRPDNTIEVLTVNTR